MSNEEAGESSRKSEHSTNEKPLKKARYVWELKGKYHLKESYKRTKETDSEIILTNDIDWATGNIGMESEHDYDRGPNKCSVHCKGKSRRSIDSVQEHAEAITSDDTECKDMYNECRDLYNECKDMYMIPRIAPIPDIISLPLIPVSLIRPNPKNEDYYLLRWQARQIAKGFVDNTINRVLEHWRWAPDDASHFVENCDNEGQVEDEGILMAIQSHGLRQDSPNSSSSAGAESGNNPVAYQEIAKSALDNYENVHNELKQTKHNYSAGSKQTSEVDDQIDFLSAAVSVAISEKGLSSCSYE